MTKTPARNLISLAIALLFLLFASPHSLADNTQEEVDFVKHIKPILEMHCIRCHGPEEEQSFRIDEKDSALDFIDEGASEDSDLYLALVSDDEEELMPPPEEKDPLTAEQIAFVKTWIDEGANWPEGVELADKYVSKNMDDEDDENDEKDPAVDPKTQRIFNAIGSLHPAAIHLPIGLLLAAGLFAFFSLRGNFVMSDCAYYCLWLGTLGAIAACVSGWWFSPMENRGEVRELADLLDQTHRVFWHRTGALIATAVAFLLALFAAGARNRDPDDGVMWKLGLILLACGIGWVGHTGGELHYPSNHYKDIEGIWNDMMDPNGNGAPPVEKEDMDEEEGSMIGKASGEDV